jgi:hypothetical protein
MTRQEMIEEFQADREAQAKLGDWWPEANYHDAWGTYPQERLNQLLRTARTPQYSHNSLKRRTASSQCPALIDRLRTPRWQYSMYSEQTRATDHSPATAAGSDAGLHPPASLTPASANSAAF